MPERNSTPQKNVNADAPLLPAWMTGETAHAPEYWHRLGQLVFRNTAVLLVMIADCPTGLWGLLALESPRWSLMALIFIAAFVVQCVALHRWDQIHLPRKTASAEGSEPV